jgi:regulator of sirC expression with transglutaminase-like and TPR domain
VDVFEGAKILNVKEAGKQLSDTGELGEEFFHPATKRSIILRMLRNLLGSTLENEKDFKEAIPYLNLVVTLDPEAAVERITRARVNERMGDKIAASADVQWLMENFPEDGPEETRRRLDEWLQTLRP